MHASEAVKFKQQRVAVVGDSQSVWFRQGDAQVEDTEVSSTLG